MPYFLTLLVLLSLLLVGLWALRVNGVSATDGGFLQVLMTTRGSEALDKAARGGCLGGEENIPLAIRGLEVMFGEFIERPRDGGTGSLRKRMRSTLSESDDGEGPAFSDDLQSNIELEYRTVRDDVSMEENGHLRQGVYLAGFGTREEVVPLVAGRR